jgi:tetratricopeptide (TPR) repeat protein
LRVACNRSVCQASGISFLLILLCATGSGASGQQIPAAQRAYEQGLKLEQEGRHQQAALKFLEVIGINPEFGDAYYGLGSSELHAGRTEEGIKAFLQLAQIEPRMRKP